MIKTTADSRRFGRLPSRRSSLGGGKINSVACPSFEGQASAGKGKRLVLLVVFILTKTPAKRQARRGDAI
jgi:hypothetical protein